MITVVSDRESDIYDQFARRPARRPPADPRGATDRALEAGVSCLFDAVAPVGGSGATVDRGAAARRAARPHRDRRSAVRRGGLAPPGPPPGASLRTGETAGGRCHRNRSADGEAAEALVPAEHPCGRRRGAGA